MINKLLDEPYWSEGESDLKRFIDEILQDKSISTDTGKGKANLNQVLIEYLSKRIWNNWVDFERYRNVSVESLESLRDNLDLDYSDIKEFILEYVLDFPLSRSKVDYVLKERNLESLIEFFKEEAK